METKIVNICTDKYDVKICRTEDNKIPLLVFNPFAPANGVFGNPFSLHDVNDDKERDKVIADYKEYFLNRIKVDDNFRQAVLGLRGKRLACFCAPKRCHGDVIVEWLNENTT